MHSHSRHRANTDKGDAYVTRKLHIHNAARGLHSPSLLQPLCVLVHSNDAALNMYNRAIIQVQALLNGTIRMNSNKPTKTNKLI